jgi:hypothetical protein
MSESPHLFLTALMALLKPSHFKPTKTKRKSIDSAEERFTQQLSVLSSAVFGYRKDGG